MRFSSKYGLHDQIIIAGDIRALVTAVQFSGGEPLYRLSWFAAGSNQTLWLGETELEHFSKGQSHAIDLPRNPPD